MWRVFRLAGRLGLLAVALIAASVTVVDAQSPVCLDLQSQYLSMLRQSGGRDANSGRRMVDMDKISRELANAQAAARQGNCNRLLFFGPRRHPQCPAIMAAINRMQRQLSQMRGQTQGGFGFFARSPEFEKERLRDWLMQYNCDVPSLGGYRTICVRTCDGYYFPISFSTSRQGLGRDAEVCQSMYGQDGQAELFSHNTNGDPANAVSLSGARYADEPYAFLFRQSFSPVCASELKAGIAALGARYWSVRGQRTKIAGRALIPMPMPHLRPADPLEDPETIANRAGLLPVAPYDAGDDTTATVASTHTIRKVGDAYYAELFDPARGPAKPVAHRPPLGFDLIGAAMAMEDKPEMSADGQQLPQ